MSPFRQFLNDLRWPPGSSLSKTYSPVEADDSRTDSSEPFLEKEIEQIPTAKRASECLKIFIAALFGMTVALLFVQLAGFGKANEDDLYHSPIPPMPYKIHRFTHDSIFAQAPSPRSDAAWGTLEGPTWFTNRSPYNQVGHIRVEGSARWEGLEPGFPLPDGTQKYSVSYAHQLHCLTAIRRVSFELLHGEINTTEFLASDDASSPYWVPVGFGIWHLTHCFDYLRQALQCAGDTSLEWPMDFDGKKVAIGWDIPHKCVDWNTLQTYMEDNG